MAKDVLKQLVERLRDADWPPADEAADEILWLQAENKRLKAENKRLWEALKDYIAFVSETRPRSVPPAP